MTDMNQGQTSTTEKAVPQMHDAYYKARKLYILFSILLFSTQLVGFDIKEVSVFGITANINLKYPNALEWGYLILMAYSAIRFTIEWFQVDLDRRKSRTSKLDFWLTHSIAISAGTLWGTQKIPGFQVAKAPLEFLLPFFVGLITPLIFNFLKRSKDDNFDEKQKKRYKITFIALCIIAPVLTLVYLLLFIYNISLISILSLTGAFIIGMLKNVLDGIPFPSSSATKLEGTVDGVPKR